MHKNLVPLFVTTLSGLLLVVSSHAESSVVFLEQPPAIVERVAPEYPPLAKEVRVQGEVILDVTVDPLGAVTEVRERKGLPIGLTEAAGEAVRRWKFEPTVVDENPVSARFFVRVEFKLDKTERAAHAEEILPLAEVPEGTFLQLSKVPESSVAPAPEVAALTTTNPGN